MRPDLIFTYIAGKEIPPGMQTALNQGYKVFDLKQTAEVVNYGGCDYRGELDPGRVFITVVLRYKL